jgi:ketosteroid isomerase-like protein
MKDLSTAVPETPTTSWHMPRLPHISIPRFALHTSVSTERTAVETYIHQRF